MPVDASRSLASLIPCAFHPLSIPVKHPSWSVYNPSVCRDPAGGYQCFARFSSWPQATTFPTQSHVLRVALDDYLTIKNIQQLEEPPRQSLMDPYASFGPEDARLFRHGDQWFASATFCDVPECYSHGKIYPRMGLMFLGQDFRWTRTVIFPSRDGMAEKNWMPIEGELAWLYAPDQTVRAVYSGDKDNKTPSVVFDAGAPTPPELAAARGGTQLVEIAPNKLLGVIHETVADLPRKLHRTSGYCRAYMHRLVLYSREPFALLAFSPRFHFLTPQSIEFAAGITHAEGRVVISFGHHDRSAWFADVHISDVLRLLDGC